MARNRDGIGGAAGGMEHARGIGRDLVSPGVMALKAVLFLVAGGLAGGLVVMQAVVGEGSAGGWAAGGWSAGLYVVGTWSVARAYYFGFYVITAYCDPRFRYAGVWSAVRWVLGRGS